jgi:hypothetical protein
MSKHHHHPGEGHLSGKPARPVRDHLHHNWFFYVSGIFIFIALLAFIASGNLAWQFSAIPPSQPALHGSPK